MKLAKNIKSPRAVGEKSRRNKDLRQKLDLCDEINRDLRGQLELQISERSVTEELRKANAALQEECNDLREENIEMQDDIRQLSAECDHWKGLAGVYKKLASVGEKELAEAMSGVIDHDLLNELRAGKDIGTSPHFKGPRGKCKYCKKNTCSSINE